MTGLEGSRRGLLDALPVHPAPDISPARHMLHIGGAVAAPATYSATDLLRYPHVSIVRDFECAEGWSVEQLRWRGVPLGMLLDQSGPQPDAGWVTLAAGEFSITLPIDEARSALVALSLDDRPIPVVHGGPMRLLVRGGACYTSIKWLDRVEVSTRPDEGTARAIAMRRIGRDTDE